MHHIDEATLRVALALAQRAPSIHNSQPWLWRSVGDSVHLYADPERRLPVADPCGRDLLVSCGAALHHLRAALASVGWAGEVRRLPNPACTDHLASIELRPHTTSAGDTASATAINQRRTDRRAYSSWPVPAGMVSRLIDEAANEGVVLRQVSGAARPGLLAAIRHADEVQRSDPAYAAELAAWAGRPDGAKDGVPASAIPSEPPADFGAGRFPPGVLPSAPAEAEDASVLLVAGTASDDRMSWLRAGEAASAVLLAATEYRLATAPLTQALNVEPTRELLRREILHDRMVPQMIIRVGFAPLGATSVPRTPRRPVDETYRRVD